MHFLAQPHMFMHLVDDLVPAYLVVTICYLISCYIYFQPLDARFFWICKQCYIWCRLFILELRLAYYRPGLTIVRLKSWSYNLLSHQLLAHFNLNNQLASEWYLHMFYGPGYMKKGATIKSYLISHALILAGFKMWKQSYSYSATARFDLSLFDRICLGWSLSLF